MGRLNNEHRSGVPLGSPLAGYGAALAVVGVALAAQLALRPMLGHGASFLLFFAAVLVSAYLGGLGPGIAATALSAALSDYYLIPPLRTPFVVHLEESFGLLVFTLEGVLISALVAALHAARARAEAGRREIRLREERFRSLVQNSSDIVAVLDRDGTVVYESPAVQRVLGFAPEERVGTGALELLHPEDRESVGRVLSDLLSRPGARVSAEYRVLDKAGRWRQFEAVGVNLLDDPAVEGVVVNSRDVTGRKEAEEGLRRTLRELTEFKFALDESAIVAFTDVGGRITYANDNFCEISGYSRDELIGQDHRLINSGYHSKEYIRGLWRTIARGKVWRGDFRNRAKDGSIYWVDTTVVPFLDERDKPYQYVAIRYEITARKKAEEDLAEIREAERKRIGRDLHDGPVQDVAHALAEMEVARALSEGRQDPRLDEAIEALRRAGGGLREAVQDLRRENGSRRQLVRAIESLVDLNRTIGGGREVTLSVEGGPCPDLPERQTGEVLRVVQEALTNARRHARAGRVAVTLRPVGNGLRVEVDDDGRGFDPETVAAGVGLKSMQERAKALGGELSIDSTPGRGTRVTLWAPLPTSDQPSSRPMPGSTPSGTRY